jgi:protease-4
MGQLMISEAELIVDRRRLKRSLTWWRIAAVLLAIGAIAALVWTPGLKSFENHIARIRIDGLITGDQPTLDLLKQVSESNKVKGVILRIDSPGGTTAGSEAVYEAVRKINEAGKPVVAVMDTVAASGGYITAIAADHIVARGNTITGSIGVIFSFPEISKLLDTIGIRMEELKSGDLKAEPSPYKPVSDKARAVSMEMVKDGYDWFTGLVSQRRGIAIEQVRVLADGRVYTGRQAIAVKLIDQLGGEETAVTWLQVEKKLDSKLEIVDWAPKAATDPTGLGFAAADGVLKALGLEGLRSAAERAKLDGLLVLWHPAL